MTDIGAILDAHFRAGTVPAALYIGLVDGATFSQFDPVTDTMGSHAGWTEFVDYDETTRQQWNPGVVLDGYPATLNNPGATQVTPNADGTTQGLFLCDDDTKGGTTGQLYGPWNYQDGLKILTAAAPFAMEINLTMKRTPVGA